MANIIPYLSAVNILNDFYLGKILISPSSIVADESIIDNIINHLSVDKNKTNIISYCAFLNMVYQTQNIDEVFKLTRAELVDANIRVKTDDDFALFHRDNLIYLIYDYVKKEESGDGTISDKQVLSDLYKTLILINDKLNINSKNEFHFLMHYIVRDFPYSHNLDLTVDTYNRWLKRYWYIFYNLVNKMESNKVANIKSATKQLESEMSITLREYYDVITTLFNWFMFSPLKMKDKKESLKFDFSNLGTFYINRKNFPSEHVLLKIIDRISIDLNQMQKRFNNSIGLNKRKKRVVDEIYNHMLGAFTAPFLTINEDLFCVIDMKFLIESGTTGFLWFLNEYLNYEIYQTKHELGHLVEAYYIELMSKMFCLKDNIVDKHTPDIVIESDSCIFIIEFTTEYYRFSSLYSSKEKQLIEDIEKILFNQKSKKGRKKDEGKFIKLNNYVISGKKFFDKEIIPILVTEKYFGDYELHNARESYIDTRIKSLNLKELEERKPFILSIDDFEILWSYLHPTNKKQNIEIFLDLLNNWKIADKGKYLFNLSFFIGEYFENNPDKSFKNEEYIEYFSLYNLMKEVKESVANGANSETNCLDNP